MPDDVELEINTRTVTPTRGAIVVADYQAKVGRRVLFNLTHNGQFVPFGAMASLNGVDNSSVIVGDKGQVYLTGLDARGTVVVTGDGKRPAMPRTVRPPSAIIGRRNYRTQRQLSLGF